MPLARCLFAAALGYLLVSIVGGRAIRLLRRICRERIDSASPRLAALHAKKSGTPSMGGLLIFGCWFAVVAVCADLHQASACIAATTAAAFVVLGACDDFIKARGRRGLRARTKLAGQMIISLAAVTAVQFTAGADESRTRWSLPAACLFIVAMSNAVNITDGLDGLAAGCGALTATALAVAALLAQAANALPLLAAALAGTLVGFLRFNRSPASVFMGDAGSLPLGGLLGLMAVMLRCEWWLLVIGGVFVVELASVVLQVAWFRRTGRRLFRCAPLHHHFEFLGWRECDIVRRFWAAAIACAIAGLLLLMPFSAPDYSSARSRLREKSGRGCRLRPEFSRIPLR